MWNDVLPDTGAPSSLVSSKVSLLESYDKDSPVRTVSVELCMQRDTKVRHVSTLDV